MHDYGGSAWYLHLLLFRSSQNEGHDHRGEVVTIGDHLQNPRNAGVMKLFLGASPNPFDLKAALLAGHAQHPVIIHFPIALFIASVVFDLLAVWRRQPALASVAYYNLIGAAATAPLAIATGLAALLWQL